MSSATHPSLTFDEFHARLIETLPRLKGFALPYCGTPADADDAVQLTCEKALEHWRQWTGEGPLDHWLTKILVNTWRDDLRSRRLRAGPSIDAVAEPADNAADPTDQLYIDQVNAEIAKLPRAQRDVLLLVVGEGLSYKDVAEALGIPIGTVMSRLSRARHELIDKLGLENG
jgi:RNA polymerase sigma-70 factor (ECF subfamily)